MATPVQSSRDQCGKRKKNVAAPPAKYRINNEGPMYNYSLMPVKKTGKMKARSTSSSPSIIVSMETIVVVRIQRYFLTCAPELLSPSEDFCGINTIYWYQINKCTVYDTIRPCNKLVQTAYHKFM